MLSFLGRKSANTLPDTLQLFPLGTTLFPGGRLGLKVFEQRYLELAKARIADGQLFGIVTLTGGGEVGAEQTFAKVGTAVRVASFDMPQAGIFQLDVVGEDRFEILNSTLGRTGLHRAAVRWIRPEPKMKLPATYAELRRHLRSPDLDERALWMGRVMREARYQDVWRLLDLRDVLLGLRHELAQIHVAARSHEILLRGEPLLRQSMRRLELLQSPTDIRRFPMVVVDAGIRHPLL